MYTNPAFLKMVRHRVFVDGASRRSTARKYRISRVTLGAILAETGPRNYVRISKKSSIGLAEAAPTSSSPVKNRRRTEAAIQRKHDAFEWMHRVLQKRGKPGVLGLRTDEMPDLDLILQRLYRGPLSARNRALAVLCH